MTKTHNEMKAVAQIEGLYHAAMSNKEIRENDYVIFQLLTFTHYHFLFSFTCQMRCHLSEAFDSVRSAIDAALIAAYIIKNRAGQVAYVNREKPFDNYARYLGNLRKDGKDLPHPLMGTLMDQQKTISRFASHADIDSFVHRVRETKDAEGRRVLGMEYFQFARNDDERALHTISLLHSFVMILDIFSEFLVTEQKTVEPTWIRQLHGLGAKLEHNGRMFRDRVREAYGDDATGAAS
jgi:hypothetical protein